MHVDIRTKVDHVRSTSVTHTGGPGHERPHRRGFPRQHRAAEVLQPGDSAIFALLRTNERDVAAKYFSQSGGKVLYTTLSPVKDAGLQEAIRA